MLLRDLEIPSSLKKDAEPKCLLKQNVYIPINLSKRGKNSVLLGTYVM